MPLALCVNGSAPILSTVGYCWVFCTQTHARKVSTPHETDNWVNRRRRTHVCCWYFIIIIVINIVACATAELQHSRRRCTLPISWLLTNFIVYKASASLHFGMLIRLSASTHRQCKQWGGGAFEHRPQWISEKCHSIQRKCDANQGGQGGWRTSLFWNN